MASWGVMLALQDYRYNGPEGSMGFNPRIQGADFRGFFTTAEAWGNITQTVKGNEQRNAVAVKYGDLSLRQMELICTRKPVSVKLLVNNKAIKSSYAYNDGSLSVSWNGVSLGENDVVEVVSTF